MWNSRISVLELNSKRVRATAQRRSRHATHNRHRDNPGKGEVSQLGKKLDSVEVSRFSPVIGYEPRKDEKFPDHAER